MSTPLLLRAFVKDRLTAAAAEIFQVFEKTIEKYEEEASSSKQEIERLRGLVLEFQANHKQGLSQPTTPSEQHHCEREEPSLSSDQRDQEPQRIKEEDQELWPSQQQEVESVQEFKDTNDLNLLQSSVWAKPKLEVSKPSLQPQAENSEHEEQFQEEKTEEFNCKILHFASSPSSQPQIQNEGIQYGTENERPVASLTLNQTLTDQKPTELSQLSSVTADYHCCLCAKSFSLRHHLLNHAYCMHSKDTGLPCAVCGRTLESIESLNVHLKSHRSARGCHLCGKQCSSTTALSEHMASHSGVKLHRCHVCGKECSRKADLKIHMRIHTGEKPFCCSYCCKSFTHSGHLRKHMRSHTGERPHRCDVCGKGFLQSTHLKYHLGTHTQKY